MLSYCRYQKAPDVMKQNQFIMQKERYEQFYAVLRMVTKIQRGTAKQKEISQ